MHDIRHSLQNGCDEPLKWAHPAEPWIQLVVPLFLNQLKLMTLSAMDSVIMTGFVILLTDGRKNGNTDGYIGFHAALRRSYNNFIQDLSKQCKQLIRHHLDSVTSPYSQVCYEKDFLGGLGSSATFTNRFNQASAAPFFLELSDGASIQHTAGEDQENMPPNQPQHTPPGKGAEAKEALRESNMTVPETPSPDQPSDIVYGAKEKGKCNDIGRRRHARILANSRNAEHYQHQNGSLLFGGGDIGPRSGSAYSDICSSAAQHFAKIREVLIERSVLSTLNSGFLTPW